MKSKLTSLKNEILKRKFDAILVSSLSNIIYLTDFSYFTPFEREAFLLILKDRQYILTDGRYANAVVEKIKDFELIEISGSFPFEKAFKDLVKRHKIKRLGFDHYNITVAEHEKLLRLLNDLPAGKAGLNHFTFDNLRTIKSPNEILNIQKACELGDNAFKYILNKIKPGVSEKQIAFELEFFIKKQGFDISFPPIVAFGKNSAIPHHKTSNAKLGPSASSGQKGQFVLFDFGAKVNNYCSDMTRTLFFGKPTREHKRIYKTVLEAQNRAIETLTNKVPPLQRWNLAKNTDKAARDYIISKGYPTIPHSLGHGVGLEVHEKPTLSPKSKDILKKNMVFSIEPGIYIPGVGGVRIEDLVVLETSGLRVLTKSPKNLIQI